MPRLSLSFYSLASKCGVVSFAYVVAVLYFDAKPSVLPGGAIVRGGVELLYMPRRWQCKMGVASA